MEQAIKIARQYLAECERRLKEYEKDGGEDTEYHEGKITAAMDIVYRLQKAAKE